MSEKSFHKAVCQYIRLAYPSALFNSDLSGSMRLSIGQAVALKSLRSGRGWPDIFIAERKGTKGGLYLELKKEGEKILKRNGEPVNDHVAEQIEMLQCLRERGYMAEMVIGFDQTKEIIDKYMKL